MDIAEFKLERYFSRWEFAARHLLCSSDCETLSIGELLQLSGTPLTELTDLRLGYTESSGGAALRSVIAARHPGLDAEDVLVTNAPQEGIFLSMLSLLRPGDRVIVQTPCYQSLREIAVSQGCVVEPWPLREGEGGWHMDLDALSRLLQGGARLVVVNAPHNPTGYLPGPDLFAALIDLVRRHDAWLFSDEMYRGLEHDPSRRLPSAATCYERAVSLSGMSKTFGLAGLRIGWLALRDRALRQRVLRLKDYTTICNSAPGELLARVALVVGDQIIERNLAIIRRNLVHLRGLADRWPEVFAWREPQAGSVMFMRLVQGGAAALCERAAQGRGVLLVPSGLLDHGDSHVRFGLGRQSFAEGLAVLEDFLATEMPRSS